MVLENNRKLSNTSVLTIPITKRTAKIILKVKSADARVSDVSVRLLGVNKRDINDWKKKWERYGSAKRKEVTKSHSLGDEYITRSEIENYLSKEFRPIGPDGIEGRDYVSRTVYEIQSNNESSAYNESLFSGHFVSLNKYLTVPLLSNQVLNLDFAHKESILLYNIYDQDGELLFSADAPIENGRFSYKNGEESVLFELKSETPIKYKGSISSGSDTMELGSSRAIIYKTIMEI